MSIEGGRATDYVMRLSKNVKRGLNSKAMRGWRPSGGPIGYLNVGTEKEYRRAQVLVGRKGKPQPQTREFAFTGLMHCGECDSTITAEEKNQITCSGCKYKFSNVTRTACPKCSIDISDMENPKILNYVYYHCTKKKNKNCSQKNIKLGDLESQFDKILGDITIDQEYLELALDYLQDKQKNSGGEEKAVRVSLQSSYDDCQTRLVNISREFSSPLNSKYELYTPEEFKEQKIEFIAQRTAIEKQMGGTKEKLDSDLEIAVRVFNFCTFARDQFNKPDLRKKREIFSTIGSNLILKDKVLTIDKLHPYLLIENEMREQKALVDALEPRKIALLLNDKRALSSSLVLPGSS